MKQRQNSLSGVVEIDLMSDPYEELWVLITYGFVYHREVRQRLGHSGSCLDIVAGCELALEQIDSSYGEDEPEDEADQHHLHYGGDGLDEGVHHYLEACQSLLKLAMQMNVSITSYTKENSIKTMFSNCFHTVFPLNTLFTKINSYNPLNRQCLNGTKSWLLRKSTEYSD